MLIMDDNINKEIDKLYKDIKKKLVNIKNKHPQLGKIWLNYLQKHTLLYKRVINEVNNFIINVDETLCDNEFNERNILLLYLILNNDINI